MVAVPEIPEQFFLYANQISKIQAFLRNEHSALECRY